MMHQSISAKFGLFISPYHSLNTSKSNREIMTKMSVSSIIKMMFIISSITLNQNVSAFSNIENILSPVRTKTAQGNGNAVVNYKMLFNNNDITNNLDRVNSRLLMNRDQGINSFPSQNKFHRKNKSKLFGWPTSSSSRLNNDESSTFNIRNPILKKIKKGGLRTRLDMVLTTPDSIFEEISTQKLLDELIDESVRTNARKPIMMQFDPSSKWIWRRWKGTVFAETWISCIENMAFSLLITYLHKSFPHVWDSLSGFNMLWGHVLSVTTFTLTFFVNQSYALWRTCYGLSRRLQGRLNDLGMAMAAYAQRTVPDDPSEPSTYTAGSRQILDLTGRYIRVLNLLAYGSLTSSHRPILTPKGMRRLVDRGIITSKERQILSEAEIPITQRHNAILLWIMRVFLEGRRTGLIEGGESFEKLFLENCCLIHAQIGGINGELKGRMPLAYAHIVQVLVDVTLWMYPIMAFSTGMSTSLVVLGTGLMTMSYQGLFDLAKQFLDPYDNESYGRGDDPFCVDTLVAETNAGSIRWMNSFEFQPFSSKKLKDGELYDESILPIRGYSVEELREMEDIADIGLDLPK